MKKTLEVLAAAALGLLSGTGPLAAQEFKDATLRTSSILASSPAMELAARAGSAIREKAQRSNWPGVIAAAQKATVQIEAGDSTGTGFIIDKTGLIVTNAHVVSSLKVGDEVKVNFSITKATGVLLASGNENCRDLALIGVDAPEDGFQALPMAAGNPQMGEDVLAMGFPAGPESADGESTLSVSRGIVSGLDRRGPEAACLLYVQTDAAINGGNSGGPLLNRDGKVVGVNTWIFENKQNIGFAIRMADVHQALAQFKRVGNLDEGSLGIMVGVSDAKLTVFQAIAGRAGALAGVLPGDILVSADGQALAGDEKTLNSFIRRIRMSVPGDTLTLVIERAGKQMTLPVVIEKAAPPPQQKLAILMSDTRRG